MFIGIRNVTVLFFVIAALLFVSTPGYSKEYANPKLLVTPADIEKHKAWIVIDCRDKADSVDKKTNETIKGYDSGHIPGAITLGGECAKVLRTKEQSVVFKDDKGKIEAAKYEKILGDAGISNDKTVVVYANAKGITSASVGFWILEYLGHKDVRFLNGGIEGWEAAGKKLDTKETKLKAAKYKVNVMQNRIATTDEMLKIAKGELKGIQVIDSRSEGEHKGTDVRAKRGGHIPNTTMNVSHTETYDKKTGNIKSMDELEKFFGKLDKTKRTIGYCQTGTRSTLTYLELKLMGFKEPVNYDDSWIIWGNREDTPIVKPEVPKEAPKK
ncbi:MAG: sulfurtransferase [Nitrospirae bacterium]|nr:sulfurtransferase [Nitrospirota bacterium]